MLSPESIQRVREAADIVQIVGEHTKLRRMGRSWRGACPLHQGKGANFSVLPDEGIFRCFTCGEHGDVFTFLEKMSGADFLSAVRIVADRAGIVLEEESRDRTAERDAREPLWEANAAAGDYFARMLWESDDGAAARSYLERRRLPREVAERFGLGYAPTGRLLAEHLGGLGIPEERLVSVGLLSRREERPDEPPYARLRDRLVIPIHDVRGNPIGFGGRLLADREGAAKYLNTPETPLFAKRRTLYNLHRARNAIRKAERVVVVEGYFDVIRLAAAGVEEVVAGLGTALTEEHAAALRKYAPSAFLLYDSDDAGQKATFRAGRELLSQGAAVRVVSLPDGEDPDSFVLARGARGVEQALADAVDMFERQVQILERAGWFGDLHRTRRAIDRLLPTLRATRDPITRDIYLARLSEAAKVDKSLLVREVEQAAERPAAAPARVGREGRSGRQAPFGEPPEGDERAPDGPPPGEESWQGGAMPPEAGFRGGRGRGFPDNRKQGRRGRFDRRNQQDEPLSDHSMPRAPRRQAGEDERLLVKVLLHYPAMIEDVASRVPVEQIHDGVLAEIFAALVERGASFDRGELLGTLSAAAARAVELLFEGAEEVASPQAQVSGSIAKLARRELQAELGELGKLIPRAEGERKDELVRRKNELQAEIARRGGTYYRHSPRDVQ